MSDDLIERAKAALEGNDELWLLGYAPDLARALIDTPTPSAPSPEAVARAALDWAAKLANHYELSHRIRTAASNPATLAAIIAKAGEQK